MAGTSPSLSAQKAGSSPDADLEMARAHFFATRTARGPKPLAQ